MRKKQNIMVSAADHDRLLKLIDSARLDRRIPADHVAALAAELGRARTVPTAELPADVINMSSTVWFRDLDTQEIEQYTLVYPSEADVMLDRISVLAPIGTALLGFRLHDIVQWRVPQGTRRLEIVKVQQPADAPNDAEPVLATG